MSYAISNSPDQTPTPTNYISVPLMTPRSEITEAVAEPSQPKAAKRPSATTFEQSKSFSWFTFRIFFDPN